MLKTLILMLKRGQHDDAIEHLRENSIAFNMAFSALNNDPQSKAKLIAAIRTNVHRVGEMQALLDSGCPIEIMFKAMHHDQYRILLLKKLTQPTGTTIKLSYLDKTNLGINSTFVYLRQIGPITIFLALLTAKLINYARGSYSDNDSNILRFSGSYLFACVLLDISRRFPTHKPIYTIYNNMTYQCPPKPMPILTQWANYSQNNSLINDDDVEMGKVDISPTLTSYKAYQCRAV